MPKYVDHTLKITLMAGADVMEQAIDLVMSQRLVEVELVSASGKKEHVYVP